MQHPQEQPLAHTLKNTRFCSVTHVEETGSTNNDLLTQLSSRQAQTGDVLVADHQLQGKGRNERPWLDHRGDTLLVSIACELPTTLALLAPLATGLAVIDVIEEINAGTDTLAGLKWPNDVLDISDNRKLAGILVESLNVSAHTKNMQLVIGIGLNLRPTQLPKEISEIAITLEQLVGKNVTRDDVLNEVLRKLESRLSQLEQHTAATLNDYRNYSLTLGQAVKATTSQGIISGIARDINNQGQLRIELESGALVNVTAGDVTHLR